MLLRAPLARSLARHWSRLTRALPAAAARQNATSSCCHSSGARAGTPDLARRDAINANRAAPRPDHRDLPLFRFRTAPAGVPTAEKGCSSSACFLGTSAWVGSKSIGRYVHLQLFDRLGVRAVSPPFAFYICVKTLYIEYYAPLLGLLPTNIIHGKKVFLFGATAEQPPRLSFGERTGAQTMRAFHRTPADEELAPAIEKRERSLLALFCPSVQSNSGKIRSDSLCCRHSLAHSLKFVCC